MGLAIDGNVVHGIARGGQAFVSLGNTNSKDGSINIGSQDYFNKNKMTIKKANKFESMFNFGGGDEEIDLTSNLSNYVGCLAICLIATDDPDGTHGALILKSQPIIIPTAPTTDKLSFDIGNWTGSLSRTTDNKFTFTLECTYIRAAQINIGGGFYILSNN